MSTKITKPEPLDPTKLHTRQQYRNWQQRMADYHNAIREEEQRQRDRQAAAEAKANAPMSDAEYDEFARKREVEKQAIAAHLAAEKQAERNAEEAYLASSPDVAEVCERSEHLFLLKLQHWFSRGYTLPEDGIQGFHPGFYSVRLNKPEAKRAK